MILAFWREMKSASATELAYLGWLEFSRMRDTNIIELMTTKQHSWKHGNPQQGWTIWKYLKQPGKQHLWPTPFLGYWSGNDTTQRGYNHQEWKMNMNLGDLERVPLEVSMFKIRIWESQIRIHRIYTPSSPRNHGGTQVLSANPRPKSDWRYEIQPEWHVRTGWNSFRPWEQCVFDHV